MTFGRQMVRRLSGLLPLLVVGALFVAPLVIWLVKKDPSPIDRVKVPGRIVEVVELPAKGSGEATLSMVVKLDTGEVIEFETPGKKVARAPGARVTVVKTSLADGDVTYGIEPK